MKIFIAILIAAFLDSSVQADVPGAFLSLPAPGTMVHLSQPYSPAYLKGIVVHPEDPLKFDFIIYKGDKPFNDAQKKAEYTKLAKYFLASLAIPDEDQWVNLSPYEKDRIIKDNFGKTEMGRDLLAQDYLLKQITASLIHPQDSLGKRFWDKVYSQAREKYGTTNIPVNTFNKVWILPDDALIYENGNTAYVLKNHLKVMMEEDYLALTKNTQSARPPTLKGRSAEGASLEKNAHSSTSPILRELVLPALEKEVNEGQNFAPLRQVYSGMLLAAWFKRTLKQTLLGQIYANKGRVRGVDQDPRANDEIYERYLQAYKKGVFNFIKNDIDRLTDEAIPRKYFSGGLKGYARIPIGDEHTLIGGQAKMVEDDIAHEDRAAIGLAANDADQDQAMLSVTAKAFQLKWAVDRTPPLNLSLESGKKNLPIRLSARLSLGGRIYVYAYPFSARAEERRNGLRNGYKELLALEGLLPSKKGFVPAGALGQIAIVILKGTNGEPVLLIRYNDSSHNYPTLGMKRKYIGWIRAVHEKLNEIAGQMGIRTIYAVSAEGAKSMFEIGDILVSYNFRRPYENNKNWRKIPFSASLMANSSYKGELKELWQYRKDAAMTGEGLFDNYLTQVRQFIAEKNFAEAGKILDAMETYQGQTSRGMRNTLTVLVREYFAGLLASARGDLRNPDLIMQAKSKLDQLEGLLKKYPVLPPVLRAQLKQFRSRYLRAEASRIVGARRLLQLGTQPLENITEAAIRRAAMRAGARATPGRKTGLIGGQPNIPRARDFLLWIKSRDAAMGGKDAAMKGGIDLNSANLALHIKRDGKGVVLPLARQDLAQLSHIQGLNPVILSIQPAGQTALFPELRKHN